jgi:predicted transcriptional regulator
VRNDHSIFDYACDCKSHELSSRDNRSSIDLTRPLAAAVGTSRAGCGKLIEAGKIEPRNDLIEQIAIALGRRLRDFAEP